jgi:hypothetical protein
MMPLLCSPLSPPTSFSAAVDGTAPSVNAANCITFLVPLGSEFKTSAFTTRWARAFWTSTIGVAPVTVIVSSREPTFSSPFTVAVNPVLSSMPSRLTALKPVNVKVTA